jgi:hypothetical protein
MIKHILIAHRDAGDPARVVICDTEDQRVRETLAELNGDPEYPDYYEADLRDLREDGWMRFEGDPPLQWVNAECLNAAP